MDTFARSCRVVWWCSFVAVQDLLIHWHISCQPHWSCLGQCCFRWFFVGFWVCWFCPVFWPDKTSDCVKVRAPLPTPREGTLDMHLDNSFISTTSCDDLARATEAQDGKKIDLYGTSFNRWKANMKFAMEHPDRMPAACEIPEKQRPVATRSIDEDDLRRAVTDITSIDERIPTEYAEQAPKLLYSTNLLPDYDLSTCYVLELCCQYDRAHHAASRHQQIPDATSVWKEQKSYLGIAPWYNTIGGSTNPVGRKDQTGQLDQAPCAEKLNPSWFKNPFYVNPRTYT